MKNIDLPAIGNRIKERRKELNISQKEACLKLNMSQNHYSRIENGHAGMSLDVLLDISEYLKISTDYILTGRHPNNTNSNIINMINSLSDIERTHIEKYIKLFNDYTNIKK